MRIILGSYMVRYPLGGMLSWVMQYLLGLKELGHDVFFVEKYGYDQSCYNPLTNEMTDDPAYGLKIVSPLLVRFGLEDKWCYVERGEVYHGLSKQCIQEVFATADLFIDMGTHGSWAEESLQAGKRVWIDGEPGYTQLKLANRAAAGIRAPAYDSYFTNGMNIGVWGDLVPLGNIRWKHLFHPVSTSQFPYTPAPPGSGYTTIMNWKSHQPIVHNGITYGQKDVEFEKFLSLPNRVNTGMTIAVSGNAVPVETLTQYNWTIKDGRRVTVSYDSFRDFIIASRGEFSVCKNVFVATRCGWFSDKSAAYLACGRPVVLQDTGFSAHIPCGLGVFAVNNCEEAADAINTIESDYKQHSRAAREIAEEYFEAGKVMRKFLEML